MAHSLRIGAKACLGMDNTIIVALIAAVGGVMVALVQRSRKENKDDHAVVIRTIRLVHDDVKEVRRDMHNHLVWHAEGDSDDRTRRRDTERAE